MARLSNDRLTTRDGDKRSEKFVPFTAFIRMVPIASEKRDEIWRDMQELANTIEDTIQTDYELDTTSNIYFDHADPVKFTPQFGDKTARLTIHGNVRSDIGITTYSSNDSFVKRHKNERLLIHGGEFKTGYGCHNAAFQESPDGIETSVLEILHVLAQIGVSPYRIEIAGIIYGEGGRHFPSD